MPFQPIVPTWLALNAANDQSPSYFLDPRLQVPVFAGGLNEGDFFDLTESEANNLSYTTTGTLHAGRYRRVVVDSGATASNVKTGAIGLMVAGAQPKLNRVTSYDKGIVGAHPVVFLNAITPGNYGFVQEGGIATVRIHRAKFVKIKSHAAQAKRSWSRRSRPRGPSRFAWR